LDWNLMYWKLSRRLPFLMQNWMIDSQLVAGPSRHGNFDVRKSWELILWFWGSFNHDPWFNTTDSFYDFFFTRTNISRLTNLAFFGWVFLLMIKLMLDNEGLMKHLHPSLPNLSSFFLLKNSTLMDTMLCNWTVTTDRYHTHTFRFETSNQSFELKGNNKRLNSGLFLRVRLATTTRDDTYQLSKFDARFQPMLLHATC
jgi:hypothetical protein